MLKLSMVVSGIVFICGAVACFFLGRFEHAAFWFISGIVLIEGGW